MTTLEQRSNTVLIVIDVQHDVVAGAHDPDAAVANIKILVGKARAAGRDVVWVAHSAEPMPIDSEGWQYVLELLGQEPEPLVHKRYPDSFEDTDFESVLAERGIGRLVVAGAQTDECIRSTLHGAITVATTRPWSVTPTPPRTCRRTAPRRLISSSPTPTCTGPTTRLRGAQPGRPAPRRSTSSAPVEWLDPCSRAASLRPAFGSASITAVSTTTPRRRSSSRPQPPAPSTSGSAAR